MSETVLKSVMLKRPLLHSLVAILAWAAASLHAATADRFDHGQWDGLLQRHVKVLGEGKASQVDYQGMQQARDELRAYLDALAAVSRDRYRQWDTAEQLAFLINAYNAWTVELILTGYPALDSIRDLGSLFRSPWSRRFVNLFGEQVSLDTLEHDLIRGPQGFGEPRIHFAVNCASIGCPALREEAYRGDRLDSQLEDATRRFLADSSRNRLDGGTLWISEIFDWYAEDFEQGWRGTFSVAQFLARYSDALQLSPAVTESLRRGEIRLRYLDYDWRLNGLAPG